MAQSKDILDLLDLLDETGLDIGFLWSFIHDETFNEGGQLSEFSHPEDAKVAKEVRDRFRALVKSKQRVVSGRDDELIQKLLSVVENGHLDETVTRLALLKVPDIVARWKKLRTVPVVGLPGKAVTAYLAQAITCYLYGLPSAAAVLCRTVLEFALQEKLGEFGGISKLIDKVDKKDHLEKLINFAGNTKILSDEFELVTNAHSIRDVGNDAIHTSTCTEMEALETIKNTGEILRHVYSQTGTGAS